MFALLTSLATVLGALVVFRVLFYVACFVHRHFIYKADITKYAGRDSWAVVTGASSGIGLGFAAELARSGFRGVVLVSRSEDKLKKAQADLAREFANTEFVIFVHEATDCRSQKFDEFVEFLGDKQITMLVNNVGVVTPCPVPFASMSLEPNYAERQVVVNCLYSTLLTRALMPLLVREQNACIVNLASLAASFPGVPLLSVYGATKAFNASFNASIATELAKGPGNVACLCVRPGPISSSMTKMRSSFWVPSARDCARKSIDKIGLSGGDICPHWHHELAFERLPKLLDLFPGGEKLAMNMTHDMLMKTRQRYLAKMARRQQ